MTRTRMPPLPVLLERYPDLRAWLEGGVHLVQALALRRAGIQGPADFATLTREEFLSRVGLGLKTLDHCERILGKTLPSERKPTEVDLVRDLHIVLTAAQWRSLGFGTVTAKAFERQGLSLERLRQLDSSEILAIRGVGPAALMVWRELFGPGCMPGGIE